VKHTLAFSALFLVACGNDYTQGPPPATLAATALTVSALTENSAAVTLASTGGNGGAVTYAIVANPQHGTLTGTAPNLTYTSATAYTGSDSATYTATQSGSTTVPATITINVASGTVLYVDGVNGNDANTGHSPAHAFKTIQSAINASGTVYNTVSVAAGTYAEYLTVSHSVTVKGPAITGALAQTTNEPKAVIEPPAAADPTGTVAIITVGDGTNAPAFELDNVKVDGSLTNVSCGGTLAGLLVNAGANAAVQNDFFWNVREPDAFVGCQGSQAIYVKQAGLDLESSLVAGFGKRGINVFGTTTAGAAASQVKVNGSHFIGFNPQALASPAQVSQNGIVLRDNVNAVITNNVIEQLGDSGAARADQGGAMVASDYSVGFGVYALTTVSPSASNTITVTGNTFTNVQGAFIDARAGVTTMVHAKAFLAANTMTGGYSVPGPNDIDGSYVLGTRSTDHNYLNFAFAQAANWFGGNPACSSSTAGGCVIEVGPGSYCLTHAIFDLTTVSPAVPGLTIAAASGAVDISIPDAALPAGYTAGSGVTIHTNVASCP
jgi:hypothetical protein